jgi:hypothetical protein
MLIAKWIIAQVFLGSCLVSGLCLGNDGALNVALFLIWVTFVIAVCTSFDEIKAAAIEKIRELRESGGYVPYWLDVSVDVIFLVMLVYHGWILSGVAWLFHIATIHNLRIAEMEEVQNESP